MTAKDLINDLYPPLKVSDSGLKAISWMEEFRLEHIPLVDGYQYLGMVTEEDLLRLNAIDQPIANQTLSLIRPFVKSNQPVFEVVKTLSKDKLTAVPVLDEANHYAGVITLADILRHYNNSGLFEDSNGVIVLSVGAKNYSLTEIASIVENESALIISSYITPNVEEETLDVTLKINRQDLTRIIASFERHGIEVREQYHQSEFIDDIKTRYDSLMNFLGI